MGQRMAANLLRHQPLNVYNRTRSKADALREQGALWCPSPREVAQTSTVVMVMVTADEALKDVLEGPQGILAGIQPGSVVVDHSTLSPGLTRETAQRVRALGAEWLDAPVTGGDVGAQKGTLTIMVGGNLEAFTRVQPFLEQMGQRILYVGESGSGQTLKLVSNMVSAMNLMAAAEGLQLGRHLGLSTENMAAVMNFGSAQSFELAKILDRLAAENFFPGFSVANRLKDLRLAVEMARGEGFAADLAGFALPLYDSHSRAGFQEDDEASYVLRWDAGNRGGKG